MWVESLDKERGVRARQHLRANRLTHMNQPTKVRMTVDLSQDTRAILEDLAARHGSTFTEIMTRGIRLYSRLCDEGQSVIVTTKKGTSERWLVP